MAKPLRETPPTSSVARLLDLEAASRAVAPAQRAALSTPTASPIVQALPPAASAANSPDELANIKREFVFSPSTDEAFSRLVETFRRATGARLSASHVARAILTGIAHAMPSVEREATRIGRMKLPGNARGREGERKRFEDRLTQAFVAAMRSAASFEPDS